MYIATVIIVIRINLHLDLRETKLNSSFSFEVSHCTGSVWKKNEVLRVMVYQKLPNFFLELCLVNKCNTQRNCQIRNMKIDYINIRPLQIWKNNDSFVCQRKKRQDICQNGKKSHPVQLVNTKRQIQSKAKACIDVG